MSFLNPMAALLAAGITVPLLVSLYFLKLRRRPMVVPSTLLWKKAIQDLQVNAPFQRIRNNLLLWLQLLLLALLLLALARPTQRATVSPGERVVIVIDHSGSMSTADVSGSRTRLEEAKDRAYELIESLDAPGGDAGASGGAMVVSFAERAQVVQAFTNDRGLLRSAVRGIEATDQRSRLEPALGLIEPFTTAAGSAEAGDALTVYVFSDGRVHRDGAEPMALPGATLAFERIGGDAAADSGNVGIVSASARRDYDRPERVSVFARLSNSGATPRQINVLMKVDGRAVRTKAVTVPAATTSVNAAADGGITLGEPGDASVTFDLTLSGGATIEIEHDQRDVLLADNTARLQLLAAQRLRVLLVTRGNRYLREAIRAAGARQLELMTPDQYEAVPAVALRDGDGVVGEGFDVVVFDRYAPRSVPLVSSLSFGAAPPIPGLSVKASAADAPTMQSVLTWTRDHPLMRYVVLDDVSLRKPGRLTVPSAAKVLAVGLAGPLIAEVPAPPVGLEPVDAADNANDDGQAESSGVNAASVVSTPGVAGGGKHVAVSFDVLESRWPHHWSFQVFMVNALETLGLSSGVLAADTGGAAMAYRVGESATVPAPAGVSAIGYDGPSRVSATVRAGRASLPAFARVGFYDADDASGLASPYDRLPVNLLDPLESDIRPASVLEVGSGAAVAVAGESSVVRKEIWPWFAWAALALLLAEWFIYTGRMRV